MTGTHDGNDETRWTGRDYFEVDLPTLPAMAVPSAAAPRRKPEAGGPATSAPLIIEELEDPDATRLYAPRPHPAPTPADGGRR